MTAERVKKTKSKRSRSRKGRCGPGCVVAVGSSVGENVYEVGSPLLVGSKHIASRKKLIGGSGINYTFRLMNMRIPVIPILPVGRDSLGRDIQRRIQALYRDQGVKSGIEKYLDDERFFCPDIHTPESTIVVNDNTRTIITEELSERSLNALAEHIPTRMNEILEDEKSDIKAVMIGHIYGEDKRGGEVTKTLIDQIRRRRGIKIFSNFGLSQIRLGVKHWSNYLKKIDYFQMSLDEAREFFGKQPKTGTLQSIIQWFKNQNLTAIITMDRFGGVATFREHDAIVLAWPFELQRKLADSTGAGDAFASGLMSVIIGDKYCEDDIYTPIFEARRWSAYACTTVGGSASCPNREQLARFVTDVAEFDSIRVSSIDEVQLILRLLDKAC